MKNKKTYTKKLFEATYVASNPEEIKKLKVSNVLAKDDVVKIDKDANNSSMALSENNKNTEEPIHVEYLSNMKGEEPFEIYGDKYQYVWAKYANGERHPAVYCFKDETTVSYLWFKENIAKHQNLHEDNNEENTNYDFDTTNLYKFLKDALYQLKDIDYAEGAKILEQELLKNFDVNKKQLEENSNINRPKDAKGNDIILKARVIINNSEIGHVLQFGLNNKGEEAAIIELMDGRKVKVPFNQIVVDDNSRIVREEENNNVNNVISFQLAKILKEKGFHKPVSQFYTDKGEISTKVYYKTHTPTSDYNAYPNNPNAKPFYKYGYSAPTIDQVIPWIKEKYNMDLNSEYQVLQLFTNNLNEQETNDIVDNTNIPKLQQDVKILVDKIDSILKPYLAKIDKPVEQAELIAAIAEKIGVPRQKLSNIISTLKTVASQTNTQQDVTSTSQIAENRKVIKTIKVKDIKK